jgi:hypothetical protein
VKSLLLAAGIIIPFLCNARTCMYRDLSKMFDCELTVTDNSDVAHNIFRYDIVLRIFEKNKNHKLVQAITFYTEYLHGEPECNHVRSYLTGKNEKSLVMDNDYGNLIVADFNFDKKDDIAIVKDAGGNGGPLYAFYL